MHLRDEGDNHPTRSDCPEKRARQQFPTMLGAKENAAPQSEQLLGRGQRCQEPGAVRGRRQQKKANKEAEQQAQLKLSSNRR
jgi:hypothetical protein